MWYEGRDNMDYLDYIFSEARLNKVLQWHKEKEELINDYRKNILGRDV